MSRFDRLATLYVANPLARVFGPRSGSRVPILMYHSISDNLFGKSHPYYQINTSAEVFANQMRCLRNAGYQAVDLCELTQGFAEKQNLDKTVVITFDDGYRDFLYSALPAMKQCGFSATIFLATDRIKDEPVRLEG